LHSVPRRDFPVPCSLLPGCVSLRVLRRGSPMRLERRVPGPVDAVWVAFTDPAGRIAILGSAARAVRVRVVEPLARVVLESTPWGGATEVSIAPAGPETAISAVVGGGDAIADI